MKLEDISDLVLEGAKESVSGGPGTVSVIMTVVLALIVIVSMFALIVSILLAISYSKYNHKKNALGQTGRDIARQVLDGHDLEKIKVSASGSLLFGNSYSHLFKKVRLRRLTWKKDSVAALAMGVQKPCLAILDQQGDADMKHRVRMTPLIYLGPLALLPLILAGWLVDTLAAGATGWVTVAFTALALLLYALAFIASVKVLKTEKKAQKMALEIMEQEGYASEEEQEMCKKLFRLYNIEYINNMIIALLEFLYRALQLFSYIQGDSAD